MRRRQRFCLALLSGLLLGACVTAGPPTGPVAATFQKAAVRAPENLLGKAGREIDQAAFRAEDAAFEQRRRPRYPEGRLQFLASNVPPGVKLPLIVYFHGCAGIVRASIGHLRWLATLDDFAVIAPDSFARQRPEYCFRNFTVNLAIRHDVRQMRLAELENAMAQIAKLPWVDKDNIFLMGHSQGGGVVAAYDGPMKVRGRIILNGYCNDVWGNGLRDDEALLTFDTGRDPWFRTYPSECRAFVLRRDNGKSIYEGNGVTHDLVLSHWPEVKAFLTENRR